MADATVPDVTVTLVLNRKPDVFAVWFQNFNTTTDFYLLPQQSGSAPTFTTAEFKLPRATDANTPGTLILDTRSPACWDWYAYQASGGSKHLFCGQWLAPSVIPSPLQQ